MSDQPVGSTSLVQKSAEGVVVSFQVPPKSTTGWEMPATSFGSGTRTGLGQTSLGCPASRAVGRPPFALAKTASSPNAHADVMAEEPSVWTNSLRFMMTNLPRYGGLSYASAPMNSGKAACGQKSLAGRRTINLKTEPKSRPVAAPQSVDNRPAVGGRLAAPAFLLVPTRVGQALPLPLPPAASETPNSSLRRRPMTAHVLGCSLLFS